MIMNASMVDDESPPVDTAAELPDDELRPLIVRSEELLHGRRELWIEHGEEMYRLRLTSSGKLYLTK